MLFGLKGGKIDQQWIASLLSQLEKDPTGVSLMVKKLRYKFNFMEGILSQTKYFVTNKSIDPDHDIKTKAIEVAQAGVWLN
jgi:hypothetical protein